MTLDRKRGSTTSARLEPAAGAAEDVGMDGNFRLCYKNGKPFGIRNRSGFLFFFTEVEKFPEQKERYERELQEQIALADYILDALKQRTVPRISGSTDAVMVVIDHRMLELAESEYGHEKEMLKAAE